MRHTWHIDHFRLRDKANITEPWYKRTSSSSSAAAKATPEASADGDRVSKLKRKPIEAKIKAGDATTSERLAFAAVEHAKKKHKADKKKSKKKKGRNRSKKHKKGSSSSTSEIVVSSSEDSSLFLKASSRSTGSLIQQMATKKSGQLYENTVAELERVLGRRGGAGGRQGAMWKRYISAVIESKHGNSIPPAQLQELYTLAEALEKMEDGDLNALGDVLTQKFKSVEWDIEGCPQMAKSVQLVQPTQRGLTSAKEMLMAEKAALFDEKVRKARDGHS